MLQFKLPTGNVPVLPSSRTPPNLLAHTYFDVVSPDPSLAFPLSLYKWPPLSLISSHTELHCKYKHRDRSSSSILSQLWPYPSFWLALFSLVSSCSVSAKRPIRWYVNILCHFSNTAIHINSVFGTFCCWPYTYACVPCYCRRARRRPRALLQAKSVSMRLSLSVSLFSSSFFMSRGITDHLRMVI